MAIATINPATEELIKEYTELTDAQIEEKVSLSASTFKTHSKTGFAERAEKMQKAADILESRKEDWAKILTTEMGKTYAAAIAEVEKCASVCRYYAEHAEIFLADRSVETNASKAFVRYLPIGPVLAVMPWNFPFWQVFRFAAPALMAGNTGLLKHASNVPASAVAIEEIFLEAGFAEGCFQTLLIGASKVEQILKDDRVRAATLTGSEPAGRAVAATSGEQIKKTVMELGGSDAFIVMASANVEKAVAAAVTGRTINNGQSCIAAKRFLVHDDIYDAFKDKFAAALGALKVGDPMDPQTDIGPLALAQIRDELAEQVEQTIAAGAVRVVGAEKVEGKGFYFTPGLLENIPLDSPADIDELFGPVASLFRISNLEEVLKLANKTRFGLGSVIFSDDETEIEQAINELDAGCTFVNSPVASDPRLPFGGVKSSGYGRELSEEGIREFVNIKTISIA